MEDRNMSSLRSSKSVESTLKDDKGSFNDSNSDSGEDSYGNSYYEEYNVEVGEINKNLLEDFKFLQNLCPEAKMTQFPNLDEVEVTYPISVDFLEKSLARAWGLVPRLPIIVRLVLSYSKYDEDMGAVQVDVYQEEKKKNGAGVLLQFQNILKNFVKAAVEEGYGQRIEPKLPRLSSSSTNQSSPKAVEGLLVAACMEDRKKLPNIIEGFLVEFYRYSELRLQTLNEYCVVCDQHHDLNSTMLKPMVCDKELCIFAYLNLGLCATLTSDPEAEAETTDSMEPEVIDLLIAMASAACLSTRFSDIFQPYPNILNPEKPEELIFSADNKGTIEHVRQVMLKFLKVEKMPLFLGVELKTMLDEIDKLLFPMVQWIVSSNRTYIVSLKSDKRFGFFKTPHQYVMRSASPAKEKKFQKAKELFGSVFSFHGSSIENWHSIVRSGLVNASGTGLQVHGAVYGPGIYTSPDSSVSFSFSRATSTGGHFVPYSGSSLHRVPPENLVCLALCEVVASKDLKKISPEIWIMPEEDHVITRFLFVFEGTDHKKLSVRSDDPEILSEIRQALQW